METETITNQQWDACAKRIEKKNMRERGCSLTWTGISRRANSMIIEHQIDRDTMTVKIGWREAMRRES